MTDQIAPTQALKPCPFCNSPAELEKGGDHHGEWFNLGCSRHWGHQRNPDHKNTCIAGRIYYTETDVPEAEAIAAWNTRIAVERTASADRGSRTSRFLADQKASAAAIAMLPENTRARLKAWQTAQSEWFDGTVLEIVSEFIAFEDKQRTASAEPVGVVEDLRGNIGIMETALQQIAGTHAERFGICQTDVEEVPDLSAEEAVSIARSALQRTGDTPPSADAAASAEPVLGAGWIEHQGNFCPVGPNTPVTIITRGGDISHWEKASAVLWGSGHFIHEIGARMPTSCEVVAYRVHEPAPSADVGELVDALKGFDDDYMTSEKHHPRYVLIPTWRFENIRAVLAKHGAELVGRKYRMGDRVTKIKGSSWTGLVVGFYSTSLTPIGYAVESENEPGSVQIYPESALAKHGGAA